MAAPVVSTSQVWVGVLRDRPDGRVLATFSAESGTQAQMELGWKQAAQAALALLAAAACASDRAGVSPEDWGVYLNEQWKRSGFRGGAS